ncbi:MAG: NAD(P)-dependent oxidoreductase [Rubrivivax sp.]|nr:NAD(P)-dependent oxidoreductase [Rubrivivax sp.]
MHAPVPAFSRLLLTGAAGVLGQVLAPALRGGCGQLRLSDLPAMLARLPAVPGDETLPCDLADAGAVQRLLQGVDAVVHLGGVSVEGPFAPILQANIAGAAHLYEAARCNGTRRVVFASSNHVTGCYAQGEAVGVADAPRPDGHYGASKLYGEGLAALYWHRWGIESVCLRIGSATPTPVDARALATWLSLRDLVQLVRCALGAPEVGCTVAYGCSANTRRWWPDDGSWARLGYKPQDNAEDWAPQVQHLLLPAGPQRRLQGGSFLGIGPAPRE